TSLKCGFGGLVIVEVGHGGQPFLHQRLNHRPHAILRRNLLDHIANVVLHVVPHRADDLLRRRAELNGDDLERAAAAGALDAHERGATEQVVLARQGLLVRPRQQRRHVVAAVLRRRVVEWVQRQRHGVADELLYLAVAVAGDVDQRAVDGRLLVQPAHRHHREELADAPEVGDEGEDGEVHVVVVDAVGVAGHPLGQLLRQLVHLDSVLLQLHGVRVHGVHAAAAIDGMSSSWLLGGEVLDLAEQPVMGVLLVLRLRDRRERLEDDHGVVRRHGAAALGAEHRVGDAIVVAREPHRLHDAGRVLLEPVRHRHVGAARPRPVVVDAEPAAAVQRGHPRRAVLLHQRAVDSCGLGRRVVHDVGGRDHGADMVVQQLQPVQLPHLLQLAGHLVDLVGEHPELAVLAGRGAEVSRNLGEKLGADADDRLDAEPGALLDDDVELLLHLQHDDGVEAHGARGERERDVVGVLVAIADQVSSGLGLGEAAHGDEQLRLGASLEAVAVAMAEGDEVLDDGLVLVHLDGEHALVPGRVAGAVDGAMEGGVEGVEAVLEHVGEAEDHRELGLLVAVVGGDGGGESSVDDGVDVDVLAGHGVAAMGLDGEVAMGVHGEVGVAPPEDVVHLTVVLLRHCCSFLLSLETIFLFLELQNHTTYYYCFIALLNSSSLSLIIIY
ncbi:hypothetical protein EE612_021888, partial [Oryza sativa]